MKDVIQKILEAAVQAPSGENAQPWEFEVKGKEIHVFNLPDRDASLYNYNQRGSYVAHGALIENAVITASSLGYSVGVKLFPDRKNPRCVAVLTLGQDTHEEPPLSSSIPLRVTNRKPFKTAGLTHAQKEELLGIKQEEGMRFLLSEDRLSIKTLAQAGSANERIMLENQHVHDFFYSHVNWTKEEDDEKKVGFFIDTLEIPPPARPGFKLFGNWGLLKALNYLGASRMVAKQNAATYASCAAMGVIVASGSTDVHFIQAGRLMQRIWLTVTKLKLQLQPLTGVLFFMQRIRGGDAKAFAPEQVSLIGRSYKDICDCFGLSHEETIIMMFRIGDGDPPTARSARFSPTVIYD